MYLDAKFADVLQSQKQKEIRNGAVSIRRDVANRLCLKLYFQVFRCYKQTNTRNRYSFIPLPHSRACEVMSEECWYWTKGPLVHHSCDLRTWYITADYARKVSSFEKVKVMVSWGIQKPQQSPADAWTLYGWTLDIVESLYHLRVLRTSRRANTYTNVQDHHTHQLWKFVVSFC